MLWVVEVKGTFCNGTRARGARRYEVKTYFIGVGRDLARRGRCCGELLEGSLDASSEERVENKLWREGWEGLVRLSRNY